MIVKGRIIIGNAPSVSFIDADPFLFTWDTGTRITAKIPYQSSDVYFTNNVHDYDFSPLLDSSTSPYYGGNIKFSDPLSEVRIDFRKYKANLSYLSAFGRGMSGTGLITFYYIEKGTFTKTLIGTINSGGWQTLTLPQAKDISWLVMNVPANSDYPSELEVYGSYVAPATVTPTARTPKFKQATWVNCFEWNVIEGDGRPQTMAERIALLQQHGGIRHYLDRLHLEPAKGDYYFSPSNNNAGSWDYDAMYQGLFNAGIDVRVCIKNAPQWLQDTWPTELRTSEQLPIEFDTDLSTTIEKAYLPSAYLHEGKLFFQVAARYGSTTVATNLISVHAEPGSVFPNNTKRTGLGWVNKLEVTNEPDSWWKGLPGFMNGVQLAARMSCVYDGHKNTMGADVGIKNADPNMNVSFPGLAVATIETYQAAIDWCRENRGYKNDGSINLPWDAINYHSYSNDGGSVQNGGATTRGMAPEVSGYGDKMQQFIDFTDRYMKGMPVILGEYGYDISQFSDQRAARPIDIGSETSDKTTRKLVQAQWMLRTALLGWVKGLQEVQVYMLEDVSNDEYGHYAQGGLVDGFVRRPSGNFFYQAKQLIGEYIVDSVLSTSPYVVKGKNGIDIAYVCWMPTETNATGNYNIPFTAGTSITLYTLSTGSTTPTTQNITTTGTFYTVACSETPVFIKVNAGGDGFVSSGYTSEGYTV